MIKEKIINAITGEETIIEREETPEEKSDRLNAEKAIAELQAKEQATTIAKAAILEKLGITEDEAKALLS